MRWGWSAVAIVAFAAATRAADEPQNLAVLPCPQAAASDPACNPSKADLKKSKIAFAANGSSETLFREKVFISAQS